MNLHLQVFQTFPRQQFSRIRSPKPPYTLASRQCRLIICNSTSISSRRDGTMATRLEAIKDYINLHGHSMVPQNEPNGLGRWAAHQRWRFKAGTLPEDTYRQLLAIGFVFDAQAAQWQHYFQLLASFHTLHGHCEVRSIHEQEYPGLEQWIGRQRRLWRQQRLPEDRFRRLDGLGLIWQPRATRWQQRLEELVLFKNKYGHCNVPKGWPENPKLASWVESLRIRHSGTRANKTKRKPIPPALLDQLQIIGFEFSPRKFQWEYRYHQLEQAMAQYNQMMIDNGESPVTVLSICMTYQGLVDWIDRQRFLYRRGKLSTDRIHRLESVKGFKWDAGHRIEQLDGFIQRHGYVGAYIKLQLEYWPGTTDSMSGQYYSKDVQVMQWLKRVNQGQKLGPSVEAALKERGFSSFLS